jgi:hypothetical protein
MREADRLAAERVAAAKASQQALNEADAAAWHADLADLGQRLRHGVPAALAAKEAAGFPGLTQLTETVRRTGLTDLFGYKRRTFGAFLLVSVPAPEGGDGVGHQWYVTSDGRIARAQRANNLHLRTPDQYLKEVAASRKPIMGGRLAQVPDDLRTLRRIVESLESIAGSER